MPVALPDHFEELWEQCEKLHAESGAKESVAEVLDELGMKINLYKILISKGESVSDELKKAKSRSLGEILLTLTHLSLKENINVFESLAIAQQYRRIENYQKIPDHLKLPR